MFCAYRAAHEAAPWTPEPYDVAQTPSGYDVVVEYVHGDKILPYIVLGILTPEEVGQGLSDLLHELHTATTTAGSDAGERDRPRRDAKTGLSSCCVASGYAETFHSVPSTGLPSESSRVRVPAWVWSAPITLPSTASTVTQ